MSSLAARLRAQRNQPSSTETQRICRLPVREYAGADLTAELRSPGGTMTLRPLQNQALAAIRDCGGGLFPLGVGVGKTLITALAGTVLDARLVLLLVPPSLREKTHRDLHELQQHFRMVPIRVLSYNQLSRQEGTDLLDDIVEHIEPERLVIVADEAHRIARFESARTKRVIRFFQEHPRVKFVALSGTLTSKSLRDFGHLAELALRNNSPVPFDRHHLEAWAECIDVDGRPNSFHWEVVRPLYERYFPESRLTGLAGRGRKKAIRQCFQRRLKSAPGVVCSEQSSLGASLVIHGIDIMVPLEVAELAKGCAADACDPTGEPLLEDAARWRLQRQLSCGFYYIWDWPHGADNEWLDARRDWSRHVRRELERHAQKGYDSPGLVAKQVDLVIETGGRRRADARLRPIHNAWAAWKLQKDKPAPPTVPVWLDDFLIDDVVRRLDDAPPTLVWYDSDAVAEALEIAGLTVYRAADKSALDALSRTGPAVTCAVGWHWASEGLNLQHLWSHNLIAEPPSSGKVMEQLLGRTHRAGQPADEVHVWLYQHTRSFRQALKTAREDAVYIEDTSGNAQKLNLATWEGIP